MFTPFLIVNNYQYGPYAHFWNWTLISDRWPNDAPKVSKYKLKPKWMVHLMYTSILCISFWKIKQVGIMTNDFFSQSLSILIVMHWIEIPWTCTASSYYNWLIMELLSIRYNILAPAASSGGCKDSSSMIKKLSSFTEVSHGNNFPLVMFLRQSICYEKAGDWPNENRNFAVQN